LFLFFSPLPCTSPLSILQALPATTKATNAATMEHCKQESTEYAQQHDGQATKLGGFHSCTENLALVYKQHASCHGGWRPFLDAITGQRSNAAMQQKGISSPALVASLLAPPPALLKLPLQL
jgi:hypothetical protein